MWRANEYVDYLNSYAKKNNLLKLIHFNHVPVGSNAIIIRFMKGVYNLRPSKPKYCKTWDVSNVLGYNHLLMVSRDTCP
jgi:hypothetical protein